MTALRGTPEPRATVPSDHPPPPPPRLLPPRAKPCPQTLPTPKIALPAAAHGPRGCIITALTPPAAICLAIAAKVNPLPSRPWHWLSSQTTERLPAILPSSPCRRCLPLALHPPPPHPTPPPRLSPLPPACHPHKPRHTNFYQPCVSFCIFGPPRGQPYLIHLLHFHFSLFFCIYPSNLSILFSLTPLPQPPPSHYRPNSKISSHSSRVGWFSSRFSQPAFSPTASRARSLLLL